MSRSSRFAVAIHVLVALRWFGDKLASSELLAKSICTNAVVVRRVIAMLREAGFVTSQAGTKGGARLAASAADISLLEVYRAVGGGDLFCTHAPSADCPIGVKMPEVLDKFLLEAQAAMEERLGASTIEDVYRAMFESGEPLAGSGRQDPISLKTQ